MELQTRGISSIAKWARPIMTKISTTGKATGFIICNDFCAVKKRLFNNVLPKGCGINEKRNGFGPVAYAGFSKGEARKFEINEDQNENFPAQNQVRFFCPKLGEDQKKKGLHSNLVRFLAKKRSSLTVSVLKLSAQVTNGGPCYNFAYFSMLIIQSWRPKGGGAWPNAPLLKYAPASELIVTQKQVSSYPVL